MIEEAKGKNEYEIDDAFAWLKFFCAWSTHILCNDL